MSAERSVKNNLNSFQVPLKDHPTEKSIMGQSNQRHHPPSVLTFPSVHFISFEMFQWDAGERTSRKLRSRRILCGQPFDDHHILHSRREVATSLSYAFLYRNQTTWFVTISYKLVLMLVQNFPVLNEQEAKNWKTVQPTTLVSTLTNHFLIHAALNDSSRPLDAISLMTVQPSLSSEFILVP